MRKILRISIADLTFDLDTYDEQTHLFLEDYFGAFRTDASPDISILINSSTPPEDISPPDPVIPEVIHQPDGTTSIINSNMNPQILGTIHEDESKAVLNDVACTFMYRLCAAIRVVVQYFIENNNGFFLHSACGTNSNRTVAFTGKSTAGKTTALNNLHPEAVISEDATAVRFINNTWMVFSTPFRGEEPAQAPLYTICFPKKWKGIPFLKLNTPAAVIAELSTNAMFSAPSCEDQMNRVLETMLNFGNRIPGFECYCYKTTNLQTVFADHGLLN